MIKQVLIQSVDYFANFISFMIFIRIILSWFPIDPNGPLVRFLYNFTEPVLAPMRKMINKSPLGGPGMMLDFSPVIAYLLIHIIRTIIVELLQIVL